MRLAWWQSPIQAHQQEGGVLPPKSGDKRGNSSTGRGWTFRRKGTRPTPTPNTDLDGRGGGRHDFRRGEAFHQEGEHPTQVLLMELQPLRVPGRDDATKQHKTPQQQRTKQSRPTKHEQTIRQRPRPSTHKTQTPAMIQHTRGNKI